MKVYFFKSLDGSYLYTSRKRFTSCPIATVQDKYQLLGNAIYNNIPVNNGAKSFLKVENTFKDADYIVMYDVDLNNTETLNSRWFVIQKVYLNGKQYRLDIQRDVVGEKTLNNMFGKIERGNLQNSNILINKKELGLNEILKYRKHLIPNKIGDDEGLPYYEYGNYNAKPKSASDIGKDLWGVLYFSKQNSDKITVDIPGFSKLDFNLKPKTNGDTEVLWRSSDYKFGVKIQVPYLTEGAFITALITFNVIQNSYNYSYYWGETTPPGFDANAPKISFSDGSYITSLSELNNFIAFVAQHAFNKYLDYCNGYFSLGSGSNIVKLPPKQDVVLNPTLENYNNKIIKQEDKYYQCSVQERIFSTYGYYETISSPSENSVRSGLYKIFYTSLNNIIFNNRTIIAVDSFDLSDYVYSYKLNYIEKSLIYTEITYSDANAIELTTEGDVVDEPFFVVVMPLYNCKIKTTASSSYNQYDKSDLFFAYNSIIKGLSGDNGLLVDAQIIPYCPDLKSKINLNHYNENDQVDFTVPLFYLKSSSYERTSTVEFNIVDMQNLSSGIGCVDINKKKEYTKRHYNILSPDQSGRYLFNFYDYVNKTFTTASIQNVNFKIKIALKPFSIIASCLVERVSGEHSATENLPLEGITYPSDLRGSKPNSGGFQSSLASNAFQTYLRSNSNYQQIFNKQQERLKEEQKVERQNEKTQGILNTLSAASMGAIAGSQLAGGFGISGSSGAIAGGAIAGGVAGSLYDIQLATNDYLREYELKYNQEMFDLNIGTIKNIPDAVNRISTFNEIILKDFWFTLELYECSATESALVDTFFEKYGYDVGVYGLLKDYKGGFIKGSVITSNLSVPLHNIANKELNGGVYYIDD